MIESFYVFFLSFCAILSFQVHPNNIIAYGIFRFHEGMSICRFHELSHSCASLLLKQGVSMKQIQEWLGHSDIATTRKPLSLS